MVNSGPFKYFGLVAVFEYKGEFYKAVEGYKPDEEGTEELFFVQLNKAGTADEAVFSVISDPETDGAKVPGVVADADLYAPLFAEFMRVMEDPDCVYDTSCYSLLGTVEYAGVTYDVLALAQNDALKFVDGEPQVDHGVYDELSEVSNWLGISFDFHFDTAEEAEEAGETDIDDDLYATLLGLYKEKHGLNCLA